MFWELFGPAIQLRNEIGVSENAELRAELASTTALVADRDALYEENLQLKSQFGRDAEAGGLLAAVIARPPDLPYDTLMLDVGKTDGVAVGASVYAAGSLYLGSITEVYEHTSRAALLSAPGETHAALIRLSAQAGGGIPLSLQGDGAGSMSGQVPAGTGVVEGDPVTLADISLTLAGTVSHVDAPTGSSFETVYVQLPINIFDIAFVEVRPPLP